MKIEVGGKIFKSWAELAALHKISYHTFMARVHRSGWDKARAATEPVQPVKLIEMDGQHLRVAEWARQKGVPPERVYKRMARGADIADAVSREKRPRSVFKLSDDARRAAKRAGGKKRQGRISAAIRKYKSGRACKDCGGLFSSSAMEFDHCRGKKLFNLSRPPTSFKAVATEIAKCDLVCANCHRLRTARRAGRL